MKSFFDIFQLAAMAFFLVVFLGRTLYMRLKKNISPFKLGIGKKGWRGLLEISFFVILTAWLIEVYLAATHTSYRLLPGLFQTVLLDVQAAKWAGVLLVLFGHVLFVGALLSFRDSWRIGIDHDASGGLITGGFFSFSRNPNFLFLDLYLLGTFLINGTLEFLVFTLITVISMHYQILQEESFLLATHGQDYQIYLDTTARYLGRCKSEKA